MIRSISTIAGLIAISGLAFTLIAIVIARSPYTHGNLSPRGYHRTEVTIVGQEYPFEGIGLSDPQRAHTGDPIEDGRLLYFQYGCQSCHGQGTGATVGDDLDDASPSEIRRKVREGPKGMPAFSESVMSDDELDSIVSFITSEFQATSNQPASGQPEHPDSTITAAIGGLFGWLHDLIMAMHNGGTQTQARGG